MYLPDLSQTSVRRSMITTSTPLDASRFSLDVSGVSGFFGGDEAVSAMVAVHIYLGQRWLGWYSIPGSYQIAKRYGLVPKSLTFKGLFPGDRTDLVKLFEFDGKQGPRFQAAHSGAIMQNTGHLALVFMNICASIPGIQIPGRSGLGVGVTVSKLHTRHTSKISILKRFSYFPFIAIIPITISFAACIACGVYKDWFSFTLILWGILSNGITSVVIGSGTLCLPIHPRAARSPPGDGILSSGTEFALLQGEEGVVNAITRGGLAFRFPHERYEDYIGYCCILLTLQSIAQLFLIPQGSLFGQIMFVSSLAVSWIYTLWLSTLDKEKIQQGILRNDILLGPPMNKFVLPSRTSAVVFSLCVLSPEDPSKILESHIPSDAKVWKRWKEVVLRRIQEKQPLRFLEADWTVAGYTDEEQSLLRALLGDAQVGYDARLEHNDVIMTGTSEKQAAIPAASE